MEFFKFTPVGSDPTVLSGGEVINNIDRSMWIERYQDPGEFEFSAKVSTNMRNFLPVGTLISHVDTYEIMIVENHQIDETEEDEPVITITGRSFISFLENRIVGVNQARSSNVRTVYNLTADFVWNQIVYLINDHIFDSYDSDDNLVDVYAEVDPDVYGVTEESIARTVEFGPLWNRVSELLKIDDLGIKIVRANTFGLQGSSTDSIIYIYSGVDRSASVLFSWKSGDLAAAQYLFTDKNYYNSALVLGQYVVKMVDDPAETNYDRRIMVVDGSDIDGYFGAMPTGTDLTNVEYGLTVRGYLSIVNQKKITIMQTDLSRTAKYQYRKHFNVGDLVSVDGNYGQIQVFRVVEYAEIEDENGESGHPTLALPGVIVGTPEEPPPPENEAPVAALTVTPSTGVYPLNVWANAAASTDDVGIVLYTFDFGDSTTPVSGTASAVNHTYTTAGTYTVTCTVKDAEDLTDVDTKTVTVTAPVTPSTYTSGSAIVPVTIGA